jgi:uncharacterized protein (TIGR03663 family)
MTQTPEYSPPVDSEDARHVDDSWLDRPLTHWLAWRWETFGWGMLLLIGLVTRFYDLGTRAMSHDESLHTLYSYNLYASGNYDHNPMMHGPFLYHANALIYFLFGDNDYTARIVPAIFGVGVLAMLYWLCWFWSAQVCFSTPATFAMICISRSARWSGFMALSAIWTDARCAIWS